MSAHTFDGDEYLTFSQAAKALPRRRGGSVASTSTIWRWSRHGSRGVVLRVVRIGGNVYVPRSALMEFIDARSAVEHSQQQQIPSTRSKRAMRQLDKLGL